MLGAVTSFLCLSSAPAPEELKMATVRCIRFCARFFFPEKLPGRTLWAARLRSGGSRDISGAASLLGS